MLVLEHLDWQSNSLFGAWRHGPMSRSYEKPGTENSHSQPNGKGARRTQTGYQERSRRICRAYGRSTHIWARLSFGQAITAVSAAGTGKALVTTTSRTALGGAHAR